MVGHLARKWKVIFVPLAVTALVGVAELAAPLDMLQESVSNKLRMHDTSGQVVVVGIEDGFQNDLSDWPWSGETLSSVTENLLSNGANAVYFTEPVNALTPAGDAAFANVAAKYPGQVFVSLDRETARGGTGTQYVRSASVLDGHAETLSAIGHISYWGGIDTYRHVIDVEGETVRSIPSAIAGVDAARQGVFRVDYSLDVASVPYVSVADVAARAPSVAPLVSGKDVLIGHAAHPLATDRLTMNQGEVADVFVLALAAETMLHGQPANWKWWPLWLFSAAMMMIVLGRRHDRFALWFGAGTLGVLVVAPGLLAAMNIYVHAAPALLLAVATQMMIARRKFAQKARAAGSVDPVSGLKTLNAIRNDDRVEAQALVAARVRRYTDIVSTLPPESERQLVTDILARLRLGAGTAEIFHGDDGNLYWLSDIADPCLLIQQLESLRAIFREPILVGDRGFSIDVSYGIDQQHDVALSHRLKSALSAALTAEADSVSLKLHDPLAQGEKAWSLSMLAELDAALEEGQFWVAYQPQIDLQTGELMGAEALARWTHDTRGPIGPNDFVVVAEQHGRIDRLTAYVLEDALAVAKRAQEIAPDFKVAVNLSPSLLRTMDILETVVSLLAKYSVDPRNLILEVTETLEFGGSEVPVDVMNAIRAKGIGLSIDDYGTGHSTLDYVRKIPATEVKIDRCFVENVCTSVDDQTVIASSIALTHAMGMKVVAEGIESADAMKLLAQMGCDYGQGYHIAKPLTKQDLLDAVVESNRPTESVASR
jgi:EAL domain-containing protein (putative c-di-GMP-specific phosphodiesterase class I)/CHASE2 domain-containing sensor protein